MVNLSDYFYSPKDFYTGLKKIIGTDDPRNLTGIVGLVAIFITLLFSLNLSFENSFFLTYIVAILYWWFDSRISLGLGIGALFSILFFKILGSLRLYYIDDLLTTQLAVWAYYFLALGAIKQLLEFVFGDKPLLPVPHFIFALVSFVVTAPFYKPGFIFLLDMVWSPRVQLIDHFAHGTPASLPITALIKGLNLVLAAGLIEKLILSLIIFGAAWAMYRLAQHFVPNFWAVIAGLMYVLNPFFYERMLGGQWLVLLGYLYLPIVIKAFLHFLDQRGWRKFWIFTILFALYPIISQHFTYITTFILLIYAVVFTYQHKPLSIVKFIGPLTKYAGLLVLIVVAANSWWIFNFLGSERSLLHRITLNDFEAFRTQSDPLWGVWLNVLSLYGFWGSLSYFLPKDYVSFWVILGLIVLCLSILGMTVLVKSRNVMGITLMIIFIPTVLIAVGYGSEYTKPIINLLFRFIPGFSGLRETGKLIGVLAFSYALLAPLGLWWVSETLARATSHRIRMALNGFLGACLLVIVFMSSYGFGWGFHGQVVAAEYPAGWQRVENILNDDPSTGNVLFLPWSGYLRLDFTTAYKVANPAQVFFTAPIIAAKGLDNVYLEENEQGPWTEKIYNLTAGYELLEDSRPFLAEQGVTHIMLARTADWDRYRFVEASPILKKIFEDESIILYSISP